jgi:hypothetical protein
MEEGEDQAEGASSSSAAEPLPEAVVKIESKDPAAEGANGDDDDDIIELGMLKDHYDQDVQLNGRGAMYRVTLVMVGSPISYPGEENQDDWCNLPFESLRALDSATLAFVRYAPRITSRTEQDRIGDRLEQIGMLIGSIIHKPSSFVSYYAGSTYIVLSVLTVLYLPPILFSPLLGGRSPTLPRHGSSTGPRSSGTIRSACPYCPCRPSQHSLTLSPPIAQRFSLCLIFIATVTVTLPVLQERGRVLPAGPWLCGPAGIPCESQVLYGRTGACV